MVLALGTGAGLLGRHRLGMRQLIGIYLSWFRRACMM